MHQSTTPNLSQTIWPRWASREFITLPIVQTLLLVIFGYSLSSDTVVMRQLRRWKRLWRRSLTPSYKRTSTGPFRSCWNGTTSASKIASKGNRVSCVSLEMPIRKSLETYFMILEYMKWFDWVLWHINRWRLFNVKSSLYMYIRFKWFGGVGFNGRTTIVCHFMPHPLYTYI